MKKFESYSRFLTWFMALLLVALAAGCGGGGGGGRDPILGTGATATQLDSTRPRVVSTIPANAAVAPLNTVITALFTEEMAKTSIEAAGTVTVACAPACVAPALAGTVGYAVGSRTAVFTPTPAGTPLEAGKTYTVTITTAATDATPLANALAGNQAPLPAASAYIWSFTTAAPIPPANITVASVFPADGAGGICPTSAISATFTVPDPLLVIDPLTVTPSTFIVTGPGPATPLAVVGGSRSTPLGLTSTFTPNNPLAPGTYTVRIVSGAAGVKDTAIPGDQLLADRTWTFTVVPATGACLAPIPLGTASTFGSFGGSAGMTNSGLLTVINGNIGTTAVSTAVTGFHDAGPGCTYTETPLNVGTVNGLIYTAPPPPTVACPTEGTGTAAPPTGTFGIATVARADALAAYNTLAGLTGLCAPPCAANLAGVTLTPGVYAAPGGSFLIQGGDLTLDPLGDANAVWVFQMATTLTVGGPGAAFPQNVILIPPAKANNVFWQVGSAATINAAGGGTMVGTIISQAGAAFSTAGNVNIVTLEGRVLSLGASVTLVNTVINVPAP